MPNNATQALPRARVVNQEQESTNSSAVTDGAVAEPILYAEGVENGHPVVVADTPLQVLHTPGYSPTQEEWERQVRQEQDAFRRALAATESLEERQALLWDRYEQIIGEPQRRTVALYQRGRGQDDAVPQAPAESKNPFLRATADIATVFYTYAMPVGALGNAATAPLQSVLNAISIYYGARLGSALGRNADPLVSVALGVASIVAAEAAGMALQSTSSFQWMSPIVRLAATSVGTCALLQAAPKLVVSNAEDAGRVNAREQARAR